MSFLPQMRMIVLDPFVRTLLEMGVPVDPLLRRAGLPVPGECDSNALVSSRTVLRFFEDVTRLAGADGFGLQAGSESRPEDLGWYGRLLLHSHTGAEMLARATKLVRSLHSGQLIWAEPCGDHLRICATLVDSLQEGRREAEYYVLLSSINTIRILAGRNWRPLAVELESPPNRALRQYEALSETRITFRRPHTSILVPKAVLNRPIPSDRRNGTALPHDLEARFLQTAPAISFVHAVRQMVRTLLPAAAPTIEQTAEAACISVRTLQRRLAADALSYSRLLDQVRFERAQELLADRSVPMTEVAFELGYTDQSNFSRAFRRWAEISPGAYRQALLQAGETSARTAAISSTPKIPSASAC